MSETKRCRRLKTGIDRADGLSRPTSSSSSSTTTTTMDDTHSNGSFINEIELQPPSPDSTHPLDLYSAADYHNSPFSTHSDLSFGDGPQLPSIFTDELYDPAEFDAPHSGQSLLMFDDPASDYYTYYRSPSPSGSDNYDDSNSRVSSASSVNTQFHSPHMAVAQSFENMSFHSPNWGTQPLPQQKPSSPPRLIMPEPPIVINAPEDASELGPSLHIVPATPISGGGGIPSVPSGQPIRSTWLSLESHSNLSSRSPSPLNSLSATPPAPSRSPSVSPQPSHLSLLYPQQPRLRSKSDTSLEPPNWDSLTAGEGFSQNRPPQQTYQGTETHPLTLGSNFTFGSSSSSSNSTAHNNNDNAYLSTEYAEFNLNAGGALRRSKSDAGGNAGLPRHRGSRSEDFRSSVYGNGPGTYLSPDDALYPPTAHGDFVRSQQGSQFLSPSLQMPQLMRIHPSHSHSQSLSNSLPRSDSQKHYRRASSGSRAERGPSAGTWDGSDLVGSNRPSPYPSPNASPRGRPVPLGSERQDEYNFDNINMSNGDHSGGLGINLVHADGSGRGGLHQQQQQISAVVSKPNVTTGRTADASQKRRKQEATFVCPIPGCRSTFTRSFNLKGGPALDNHF